MVMGTEKQEKRCTDARDEENMPHPMGMQDVCELYGAVWLWMEVQRLQNYRKHLYFSKGGSKVEGPAVTVTTHPGIEVKLLSKPVSYVIKVHVEFIKRQLWVVCVKTMSHFWWHVPFDAFLFWRRNVPNTVPITAFLSSKNVSDVIYANNFNTYLRAGEPEIQMVEPWQLRQVYSIDRLCKFKSN